MLHPVSHDLLGLLVTKIWVGGVDLSPHVYEIHSVNVTKSVILWVSFLNKK